MKREIMKERMMHRLFWLAMLLGLRTECRAAGEPQVLHVQKCCELTETMVGEATESGPRYFCQQNNDSSTVWLPPGFLDQHNVLQSFQSSNTTDADQPSVCVHDDEGPCVSIMTGRPDCGPLRGWSIVTFPGFHEDLQLRPDSILRQVIDQQAHEYEQGQYCVDQIQLPDIGRDYFFHGQDVPSGRINFSYAMICASHPWTEDRFFDDFVSIFYPIGLAVGIFILTCLVIIHLALKELRDLSGCMLISLYLSIIASMMANMILVTTDRISNAKISLFFLECMVHSSDVSAHFWLNAIGHRAWMAVRYPRKEAMRPEGKRYFLYCIYSWGSAMTVLVLALAVHFFIDVHTNKTSPHSFFTWYRIGWLALALFCTSIVFLLVVNIIFYATTRMKINQQTAYGRTFHRHKGFFHAFARLFFIIETIWVCQVLSWLQLPVLVGLRIVADIALPFLILWTTLKGRRVMHLLKMRLQMSQCWLCRACFASKKAHQPAYYGEEMTSFSTPI